MNGKREADWDELFRLIADALAENEMERSHLILARAKARQLQADEDDDD